jgi:hypothetical protein
MICTLQPAYSSFVQDTLVKSWGYEVGRSALVVPYDWRLGSAAASNSAFYTQLKATVEQFVDVQNGGRPAVWIAHSNGPPTVYGLLTGQWVDAAWRQRYIAGFIPLSGNMAGQANNIEALVWNQHPSFVLNRTADPLLQG